MFINGIFEGGGIKGLAYIGVMRFLEERGFQFRYVGGSSIGAVIASLIAVGYDSYQLEEIVNDFDLSILTEYKYAKKIPNIIHSVKQKGLHSIDNFEKYLTSLFRHKNKLTFRDVKIGNSYRLKVIATDLKNKKMVVIPDDLKSYGYNPDDFPIAKAVAMSATLPIFFAPYKFGDNIFVDGGVSNNFPITLFSASDVPTLGFRLGNASKLDNLVLNYQKKIFKLKNHYDLNRFNIIDIDTFDIKATDFKEGMENRVQLYLSGYNSMRYFFYKNFRC